MSVQHTINRAQRTIFITGSGDLNRSMLQDLFRKITTDPAFDPSFDTVADFSDVVYLDLNLTDIQSLVERTLAKDIRNGRFAIITGTDQGRYSLGVYFSVLAEGVSDTHQRIFRTAPEAHNWLASSPIP
ncbi:MAG: hypothetical protein NUV50_12650 [Rhodospirillales bacterium]|nr:hypothetical protein [Rhodospirillales bacterium]